MSFAKDDAHLLLYYRFIEPSGTPIQNYATNVPATYEDSTPFDASLEWYSPYYYNTGRNPGVDGLYRLYADPSAGSHYPPQWGTSDYAASGFMNLSNNFGYGHDCIRSKWIGGTSIAGAIGSGQFTLGLWIAPEWEIALGSADHFFWCGKDGGASVAVRSFGFSTTQSSSKLNAIAGGTTQTINSPLMSGVAGNGDWNHIAMSYDPSASVDGIYWRVYLNGELVYTKSTANTFATPYQLSFLNYWNSTIATNTQAAGAIKDFFLFDRILEDNEISDLFNNGINYSATIYSTQGGYTFGQGLGSGIIGGFLYGVSRESGIQGGYVYGTNKIYENLGGYIYAYAETSGILGGYLFAVNRVYESLGSYLSGYSVSSGILAGYTNGVNKIINSLGSYVQGFSLASGIIGGFINGGYQGSGIIDGSFRTKAITHSDFDALLHVYSKYNSNFDAQISIFKAEKPPFVSIKYPDGIGLSEGHDVSGVFAPLLIWFVGSGVPVDGKTINSAVYNFGDLTAKVFGTASGTNEYVTAHNYSTSGIYVASLKVIDSKGLIGTDYVRLNLASGIATPDISLTANPQIGYAPLTVDFDYSISNIPENTTIVSKVLLFGDGQSSISPNINHIYNEAGFYIPMLIVKDSRGFIFTDTIEIGVNN